MKPHAKCSISGGKLALEATPRQKLLSRHFRYRLYFFYVGMKVVFFRGQLQSMRCSIERIEARLTLRRRIRPSGFSELKRVMHTQALALRELNQKYATVRSGIELAERSAFGLIFNVIPYAERFSMPRIPADELTASLFSPNYLERPPVDRILIPKFIAEQRALAQPRQPWLATAGIDVIPGREEVTGVRFEVSTVFLVIDNACLVFVCTQVEQKESP